MKTLLDATFDEPAASYHFDSSRDMYICYQHRDAITNWPALDDGQPIPSRMPFTQVEIEGTTFHGVIDWYGRFQTTWQKCKRWKYEIVFDSNFLCILSGSVQMDGEETISSLFGKDLIYINAALLTSRELREAGRSHQQLRTAGASPETIALIQQASSLPLVGQLDFGTPS